MKNLTRMKRIRDISETLVTVNVCQLNWTRLHSKSVYKSNVLILIQRGILERLDDGEVIIGDGGFTMALEKRGYVMAGKWTPECTVENPEAGKIGFISRTEISSSSSKTT